MRLKLLGIILSITIILASCQDSEAPMSNESGSADIQFKLVDNPANYDAVLIDVQGLEYKIATDDDIEGDDEEEEGDDEEMEEGDDDEMDDEEDDEEDTTDGRFADDDEDEGEWVTVDIDPQVYDLLELNNGTQALLADVESAIGEMKEVRLILGPDNHLVMGGDTIDLVVPSGAQSGFKVKVGEKLVDAEEYELVIDFDAAKSVVEAGNGKYLLKPVIHATLVEDPGDFGNIAGVIDPDTLAVTVYAINADEDSVSTMPEGNGTFLFELLDEGFYTVAAVPGDSTIDVINVTDVEVIEGLTAELDTIKFE